MRPPTGALDRPLSCSRKDQAALTQNSKANRFVRKSQRHRAVVPKRYTCAELALEPFQLADDPLVAPPRILLTCETDDEFPNVTVH